MESTPTPESNQPALRRFGPAGPDVPLPIVPERAALAQLEAGGRSWLDFANGGLVPLGYSHPELSRVVAEVGHMPSSDGTCWQYHTALMRKLAELAPGGMNRRVLLTDSGGEALAQAIRLARARTGRERVVYVDGETAPVVRDAAVAVVHPFEPRLAEIRSGCTSTGALLVSDETSVGPGLAGRMFGIEASGVRPDLYVLGRGWAGGLPFGACITGSSALRWPAFNAGCSVLSAAVALATIRLVEGGLVEQVPHLSACLTRRLEAISTGAASGLGLVWSVVLPDAVGAPGVVERCRENGLLLRPLSANSFGIRPPLVVTEPEIDRAFDIIEQALAQTGRAR